MTTITWHHRVREKIRRFMDGREGAVTISSGKAFQIWYGTPVPYQICFGKAEWAAAGNMMSTTLVMSI